MSEKFKYNLFTNTPAKHLKVSEALYIAVTILHKINEPMNPIFTNEYFKLLKNVNYKLFKI